MTRNQKRLLKMNKRYRPEQDFIYGRRDAAVDQLHTRAAQLGEPEEERRRVSATLVTETPVPMFDWRRGVLFDEVLQIRGGRWRDHVVLLDSHDRYSSRSVLGSCIDLQATERSWNGTLDFVEGDPEVDPIWLRVKQRHLRGVSAGYRYTSSDFQTIAPGSSAVINGRTYRAREDREMRVVTEWEGHEVSVTPIQADKNSHTRAGDKNWPACSQVEDGFLTSPVEGDQHSANRSESVGYLEYLRSIGLAADATDAQVIAFHRQLTGEQREQADLLRNEPLPTESTRTMPAAAESSQSTSAAAPPTTPSADPVAIERERIQQIRALAETGIAPELVTRAIDGGWDLARVRQEFAAARPPRTAPAQSQQESRAPAGHVRSSGGPSLQALQAGLLLRQMGGSERGGDLDGELYTTRSAQAAFRRTGADWICQHARAIRNGGTPHDDHARAAEEAFALQNMPMVDMCREILRLSGLPHSGYDYRDMVTRALSAPAAATLFTTSFNAMLLEGYTLDEDTTRLWTSETDLPNWQPAERHQKGLVSRLRRKARGAAPEQTTFDAKKEIIRVHTYGERFEMTREDIMDDRLGGLDSTPDELGAAAAELRPDLVYSTLLSNPNMSDGAPIFGAITGGINNLTSGMGLDADSLDAVKSKMHTQTINGRPVRETARYLLVPESKAWAAKRLLGSDEDRTTAANVDRGTMNPAKNAFQYIAERRLDAGVTNPFNDGFVAGQPSSWFLSAANGKRGLQVAYLRADGRGPITESYALTEGRIGMGWTIEMVIGIAAIGRSGLAKATS